MLRPGTTLVLGPLPPEIEALAREHARRPGARVIAVRRAPDGGGARMRFGPYLRAQRRRSLRARGAGAGDAAGSSRRAGGARRGSARPGRFEQVARQPPLLLRRRPQPRRAPPRWPRSLRRLAAGRPRGRCVSVLADKDAAGMLPSWRRCDRRRVLTAADPGPAMGEAGRGRRSSPRASSAAAHLPDAGRRAGSHRRARSRLRRARRSGAEPERGRGLSAGSHYLLAGTHGP